MQRRRYCTVLATGIAAALAGCTGDSDIERRVSESSEMEFDAEADDNIILEVENSGFGETFIDLRAPGGDTIIDASVRERRELAAEAPSEGEYTLVVEPGSGEAEVVVTVDNGGLLAVDA